MEKLFVPAACHWMIPQMDRDLLRHIRVSVHFSGEKSIVPRENIANRFRYGQFFLNTVVCREQTRTLFGGHLMPGDLGLRLAFHEDETTFKDEYDDPTGYEMAKNSAKWHMGLVGFEEELYVLPFILKSKRTTIYLGEKVKSYHTHCSLIPEHVDKLISLNLIQGDIRDNCLQSYKSK